MVAYCRFQASDLPRVVGVDAPGGRRRSDGRAGHLCHGPYLTLTPGRYVAGFYVRREPQDGEVEDEVEIEASAGNGDRSLGRRRLPVSALFTSTPGLQHVEFVVETVERGCELRFWTPANAIIEITEVVLFRTDLGPGKRQ